MSTAAHTIASTGGERRDAFPHTQRPLPWVLAAFLTMLFLVPVDSTQLKVSLPVGSQIDRFAVVGLVIAWFLFGGDQRAFLRTRRSKSFVTAVCVFLTLAVASLLLDAGRIINLGDFDLAEKRFALLASFVILSWFTLAALRFEDVRGFASFLIGIGTAMAAGMLIERHTGVNLFYTVSEAVFKPIANVGASPTDVHPLFGSDGRVLVVGPTLHGLAATTMLMVVIPFALVRVLDAKDRRTRLLNGGAFAVMLAGAMATDRKTALLVPVAVVLYFAIYRPRQILRMLPVAAVTLGLLVHFAAPGAIGTVLDPRQALGTDSTTHRAGDLEAVLPDVNAHPIIGRGYGTLDEEQPTQFRINDNEYIDELWEVGALGAAAYLWMVLSPILLARRAIRRGDPRISSLTLAASAGCVAYLVVNALFDAMSFPQAPYMFFVVAALTVITSAGPEGNCEPAKAQVRGLAFGLSPAARRA